MPEARDRLARPADLAAVFAQRRSLGVYSDEAARTLGVGTATGIGGGLGGWAGLATPRQENHPLQRSVAGRGRRGTTGSVLPSWYPRTPLRDITAVVRAIERRRARLGVVDGQQAENQQPHGQRVVDSPDQFSGAQLGHEFKTPAPSARKKSSPSSVLKVQKLILEVSQQNDDKNELTPQKKLLNSIHTIEKAVKIELRKLERTPSAKKAERERKVGTLMTMR